MLISKVFAPTADGLRAIERNVVVGLAGTVAHSARHTDGTVFGNHFVVCFVLFIPEMGKNNSFYNLVSTCDKTRQKTYNLPYNF